MILTRDETELCRQWFNAVLDVTPVYLHAADYQLAAVIHKELGLRVPHQIGEKT